MIIRAAIFSIAALATASYAVRRGGAPERATAFLVVLATAATAVIPVTPGVTFTTIVWPLFAVDLCLLAGVTAVALFANRFWPLYFAALQLVTVALHGVRAFDASMLPSVYARLGGEFAYPTLVLLAIGTFRHHARGMEADWSSRSGRDPAVGPGPEGAGGASDSSAGCAAAVERIAVAGDAGR